MKHFKNRTIQITLETGRGYNSPLKKGAGGLAMCFRGQSPFLGSWIGDTRSAMDQILDLLYLGGRLSQEPQPRIVLVFISPQLYYPLNIYNSLLFTLLCCGPG